MKATLSSGVCGVVQKHRTQIVARNRQETGYFLVKWMFIFIFNDVFAAKVRCFSYICNQLINKNENIFHLPSNVHPYVKWRRGVDGASIRKGLRHDST